MTEVVSPEPSGQAQGSVSAAKTDTPTAPAADPGFDLTGVENPSFAVLQAGRSEIYSSPRRLESFGRLVDGLPDSGEEGRRKGLGLWMLARYAECAATLAAHEDDDAAAFTRGKALMSARRPAEAMPIFQRLTQAYPEEPRPRAAFLEAQLERDLAEADAESSVPFEHLEAALVEAPGSFGESADGRYLRGRLAELRRDWEEALDHYEKARELDPSLRENLFRGAHLAERCGLDELAIELYEALADLPPVDRSTLLNLGVLYEDVGRDQEAAACYDTVVRNYPTDERAQMYLRDARSAMNMYYDEDMERKEDRLNQILRIPITDFELSVRARNCLNKMQITTLGDLVCRTEQELLSYKNFGETSLNEIKEILHSKGLRLGMPREEAVASIEAHARRPQGDSSDVMARPVTDLQLSIRARRTVEALGCLTIGDITKHSSEELLGMPNFGVTSLQELKSKLAELGAKLRGD